MLRGLQAWEWKRGVVRYITPSLLCVRYGVCVCERTGEKARVAGVVASGAAVLLFLLRETPHFIGVDLDSRALFRSNWSTCALFVCVVCVCVCVCVCV